jgi:predicted thioesterase
MTRSVFALSLAIVWAFSASALAQDTAAREVVPDRRPAVIADIVGVARAAAAAKVPTPFNLQIGPGNRQRIAAYFMAAHAERAAYAALLKALEAARVDKQVGSPPNASGGTSLAMKGLAPRIFGLAVERGALTREVAGTTLTFRANPVGLVKALQGSGLVELNDDYARDALQRFSGRFSLAATFDVSRGTEPGVFTGNDQQLASWAARYTFINRRDPASPDYAAQWGALLSDTTAPYRSSVGTLNDVLGRWGAYLEWEKELTAAVTNNVEKPLATNGDVDAAAKTYTTLLTERLKKLEALALPAEVTTALDAYAAELKKVQSSIDQIYAFAGKGPLLTFDWTTTRDEGLPDLFTWTGVFEAGLGQSRKTDFTFNGSVSSYRSTPTAAEHALKSVNLTAQLEHPLGRSLPAPTLTFAASYSYLPHDSVSSTGADAPAAPAPPADTASVGMAPKGHVGLFQAKLTIPIKDSGVKVPLSITASNRTELIKEKDVRGSIGITFDLDVFMSAFSGLTR